MTFLSDKRFPHLLGKEGRTRVYCLSERCAQYQSSTIRFHMIMAKITPARESAKACLASRLPSNLRIFVTNFRKARSFGQGGVSNANPTTSKCRHLRPNQHSKPEANRHHNRHRSRRSNQHSPNPHHNHRPSHTHPKP